MGHTVQETNDNCTISKCSMVCQGYFKDNYVKLVVPKPKRRCPLINIGYYVRAVVVEKGISHFLKAIDNVNIQIVSLGAGFDTTYFRIVSEFKNIKYFEVDLEDVVTSKIKCIKQSEALLSKLHNVKENGRCLESKTYCLIAHDLGNVAGLEEVLIAAGMRIDSPTLLLSECAITYLEEQKSRNILGWAATLPNAAFLIYEQIYPDDGFSQAMLKHYDNLNLPLWSVEVYRSKEDQINRFKNLGYEGSWSCGAFEMYQKILSNKEHEEVISKEPFDEWEEWHLTSSHYTLSIGVNGIFNQALSSFTTSFPNLDISGPSSSCSWEMKKHISLQFFGHSAVEIWGGTSVLIFGGFGLSQDLKHCRLNQLCLVTLPDMKVTYISPPVIEGVTWDCIHHTCSLLYDDQQKTDLLIFGGRLSPLRSTNEVPIRISIFKNTSNEFCVSGRKLKNNGISPQPRRRHTTTYVNTDVLAFIFGGLWTDPDSKKQSVFNNAWKLSKDETWIQVKSGPPARFSHSAAAHDGKIFLTGGIGDESVLFKSLADVWSYSVSDDVWSRIEISLTPRYSHSCHILDNALLLIGGVNEISEKSPGFTSIDLEKLSASEYKLPGSTRDLPIMLHNHSSIVAPDKRGIIVIGGGGHCFSFGTYFNRHPIFIQIPDCDL